jgi:DNA-binding NarL/FixJ family response regulator
VKDVAMTSAVIVDDSVLLREGLARLLTESGVEVRATVGDAPAALEAVAEHRPDLVVMDVRLPPTFSDEGLRAAEQIRQEWPETAILVLSQYVEASSAATLLSHGRGIGYLLKDRIARLEDLSDAVTRLADGGTVLDPEVVAGLFTHQRQRDRLTDLTARERDVLKLMAEGRSNSGIAAVLFISASVVEKHIASILQKLGLGLSSHDNRRTLAVLAWLQGENDA